MVQLPKTIGSATLAVALSLAIGACSPQGTGTTSRGAASTTAAAEASSLVAQARAAVRSADSSAVASISSTDGVVTIRLTTKRSHRLDRLGERIVQSVLVGAPQVKEVQIVDSLGQRMVGGSHGGQATSTLATPTP